MKFTGIKYLFISVTAISSCMELCNCFVLDRAPQDVIEFWNGQNCVKGSVNLDVRRCKCDDKKRTIAKGENSPIECVDDSNVNAGKNTNRSYRSMQYLFYSTKCLRILSLLFPYIPS